MRNRHRYYFGILCLVLASGCASPPAPNSGFISDYSKLQKIETGRMRYISPELRNYSAFMVDPVEIRAQREQVTAEQRAEVARYMRDAIVRVLREGGYNVATEPGVGVARFRAAITDIQDAKWYMNVHPATKVTGAGRGGASMEAEVIDSVTGAQLAAAIRSGRAKQFELNPFSTLDDVKKVIDEWARGAADRLKEMRAARN